MRTNSLQFRSKYEPTAGPSIVKRLFSDPVARKVQDLVMFVPQTEGEHSLDRPQCALEAIAVDQGQQDLGIGVPTKPIAGLDTLLAQLLKIIDLAVVNDYVPAAGRHHRLMTGQREIDDGQPSVSKIDPYFGIAPNSAVIRAAMDQRIGQSLDLLSIGFSRLLQAQVDETHYAAHRSSSPILISL